MNRIEQLRRRPEQVQLDADRKLAVTVRRHDEVAGRLARRKLLAIELHAVADLLDRQREGIGITHVEAEAKCLAREIEVGHPDIRKPHIRRRDEAVRCGTRRQQPARQHHAG